MNKLVAPSIDGQKVPFLIPATASPASDVMHVDGLAPAGYATKLPEGL